MIDIKQAIKECLVEKPTDKPVKPDKTLLKDARERIMRLQVTPQANNLRNYYRQQFLNFFTTEKDKKEWQEKCKENYQD